MNSEFYMRTALLVGIAASATAAEVSLHGNGKLTGEVGSISADGTIELLSTVSKKPLRIRADKAIRIDFGTEELVTDLSGQKLHLRNGDVLPVRVESMADGLLRVRSVDLGFLLIPREAVATVQLGIFPQRLIYSGPEDFKGWERDEANPTSWTIDDGEFVAKGNGTISLDAGLPEKFILKFTYSWKNHPYLKLGFAEPEIGGSEPMDRYLFQFVGSGLGIYLESATKGGNDPIVSMNRASERGRENNMDVEIRVDRSRGQLHLYIDGVMEGRYIERVGGIPSGTGISIKSRATGGGDQRIGNIRIHEWDDRGDRHRSEERGDGKADSLIGRNGERLGGRLTGIRRDGDESVFLFKSDFQKEILELPEQEISTVFVAGNDVPGTGKPSEGFILSLRGGGRMTVSSCEFGERKVSASHPLLGDVVIDRAGIVSLERKVAQKPKPENGR